MIFPKVLVALFLFLSTTLFCQIQNLVNKFNLPVAVAETSGLLFLNGKIITHNDSGDGAILYEIDTISGQISRTISITNATNIDWEDITQDDTYVYIGDIGNNNGTRTNLKIYRILKSDIASKTNIVSESIRFSYEDQSDFTSRANNHNFDAEAISIYKDKVVIFTKNWADNTVNAYTIPKTIGNHSAKKVSSYNSNGLITGATYNSQDDSFLLCGYTKTLNPFLIFIRNNQPVNDDFFGGFIERTDITSKIFQGSQIEGITVVDADKYFLSREKFSTVINTIPIVFTQKLFRFNNGSFVLNTTSSSLKKPVIFPNPSGDSIHIKNINLQEIESIKIVDATGKMVVLKITKDTNKISIAHLSTGMYFVKILLKDRRIITKKIMKL